MCHSMHEKIKGQLCGVASSFHFYMGSGHEAYTLSICPLNHPAGPSQTSYFHQNNRSVDKQK